MTPYELVLGPAALAFVVAIGATVAVERLGGRMGGVLAAIPTTIVPASLGMLAGRPDDDAFVAALAIVPAGLLVDAAFLWTWRVIPGRLPPLDLPLRLLLMSAVSLTVWTAGALTFVAGTSLLQQAGLPPLATGMFAFATLVCAGVAACWRPPPSPKGSRPVGALMLISRGVLAATAIAVSIAIVAGGAPLAGGMASVFPAIFLTTMVSLWVSQGEAVPVGAVGPIMLGSSSVAAYALLAAWTMPALGGSLGALVAWLGAVGGVSVPAALWLARRREDPWDSSGSSA